MLRRVKAGANDDIRTMWYNSSCQLHDGTTFPSGSLDVDNLNPQNQTADALQSSSRGPRPQCFLSDDKRPADRRIFFPREEAKAPWKIYSRKRIFFSSSLTFFWPLYCSMFFIPFKFILLGWLLLQRLRSFTRNIVYIWLHILLLLLLLLLLLSTSESWGVNKHTARCTISVSAVWQCKLMSGWELRKRRSAPPYGPYSSGRSLRYDVTSVIIYLLLLMFFSVFLCHHLVWNLKFCFAVTDILLNVVGGVGLECVVSTPLTRSAHVSLPRAR